MGWVTLYGRRYPNAWDLAKDVRARKGAGFPDWPEWCFLPLPGAMEIVARSGGPDGQVELMLEASRLAALAPWRITKGVYRFDPDVLEALWHTPIETGDVPHEVFYRLPEWCVYVETPGKKLPLSDDGTRRETAGFFAHLNSYEGMGFSELRVVLDVADEEPFLFPLMLGLTEPTLEQCLLADAARSATRYAEETGKEPYAPEDLLDHLTALLGPPLSLALYLCTSASITNADSQGRERPGNPALRKAGKGSGKLLAAGSVSAWKVA